MGYICHKIRLQDFRGMKLMGHHIETVVNFLDLFGAGFILELDGEISLSHTLHCLAQLFHRFKKQAGQKAGNQNLRECFF